MSARSSTGMIAEARRKAAGTEKEAWRGDRLLEEVDERGAQAVMPSRRNRAAPRKQDRGTCGLRHPVWNLFARITGFRVIARRYDRTGERLVTGVAPSPAWSRSHDRQQPLAKQRYLHFRYLYTQKP